METCARCGAAAASNELYPSGSGSICVTCQLEDDLPVDSGLSTTGIVALAGAFIPFVLSYGTSTVTVVNGVRTASHVDYIALIGGTVAIVAGGIAAVLGRTHPNQRTALLLPLLASLVGIAQLIRGIGWL